jgi:NAD(P)-dependent dehydrogenase (short-subunit alcohol dehydrogenase family)
MQFGVNHLAHFALTGFLLPHLLRQKGARVVNVASQASALGRMRWDDLDGRKHYNAWGAYGQSKLANLLFSFELARRLEAKHTNVSSLACHPGYAATNLQYVGPKQTGSWLGLGIMQLGNRLIAQSAEFGALPTLYAASALDAKNGEYIGPSGLFGLSGAPRPLRALSRAYDAESMRKLWDVSVERTGVRFDPLE